MPELDDTQNQAAAVFGAAVVVLLNQGFSVEDLVDLINEVADYTVDLKEV